MAGSIVRTLTSLDWPRRKAMPLAVRTASVHDDRNGLSRGGVAAASAAHDAVDHDHADARDVAELHAFQQRAAGRVLGAVHEHEVCRAPDLDQADVDMRCLLIVGSSQTQWYGDTVFTPRRYPD